MSRILFLSRWFPDPPNNGSKLRVFNLLRGLSTRHDVTLLTFHAPGSAPQGPGALSQFCSHVEAVAWKPYDPAGLRARLGFLSPRPRFVVDTFSPEMSAAVSRLLSSQSFDAVIASQVDMAVYSAAFGAVPALFEEVEVGTLYEQFSRATSTLARMRYGLTWLKHQRYLQRLLRDFAACTVVSDEEQRLLALAVPHYNSVTVIPNCVDLESYAGVRAKPEANRLVFSGSLTYDANYEAMTWFLEHVYPQVRQQAPDVKLTITGDHGARTLPRAENVTLTGFVDDVRPLVAGASVSLAPILTGGGTRLKILEAMALGTPVVSTVKGAEGLCASDGKHLLLANEPAEFARSVVYLLENSHAAQQLAANARCLLRDHYDWKALMPRFLDLVESTIYQEKVLLGKERWPS